MSAWNHKIRTNAECKAVTAAWVKGYCPLIAIVSDTGVGKSTWLSKLGLSDIVGKGKDGSPIVVRKSPGIFDPILLIDADLGDGAYGDVVQDDRYVEYRRFDGQPERVSQWLAEQLNEARATKCGSVIIEGTNALYELTLAAEYTKNPSGTAYEWARAGAGIIRAFFAGIRALKMARNSDNRGIPIFVALNMKGTEVKGGDGKPYTQLVPNMSNNLRRHLLAAVDAQLELTRVGDRTTLNAFDPSPLPTRKIRAVTGATCENLVRQVAEDNLDPAGLLAVWAHHSRDNAPRKPIIKPPTEPATDTTETTEQSA